MNASQPVERIPIRQDVEKFQGTARPGTHLFPEFQYITGKHKKVSAGQA
jgi:hypothetical protein